MAYLHSNSRFRRVLAAVVLALVIVLADLGFIFHRVYTAPAPMTWSMDDDGLLRVVGDYHSATLNFDNGLRRTVGQPGTYRHTLYFFGSSAGLDMTSDDAHTLPSQLQSNFSTVRIVNESATAASFFAMVHGLLHTKLVPGDVAILHIGANDAMFLQDAAVKAKRYDPLFVSGFWQLYSIRLRKSLYDARSYAAQHSSTLVIALQPLAPFDTKAWQDADADWPWRSTATALMYPHLAAFAQITPRVDAFMFRDAFHVNDLGNAIIAREIYDALTTL